MNIDSIQKSVGNAVRSLYQVILAVDGNTGKCAVIDYNAELKNISSEIDSFEEFRKDLYVNVHPEERDSFGYFMDPEYFPEALGRKVYISMECRIRHSDYGYFWSEITFCNASDEDKAGGDSFLFLIRDVHDRKMRELRREAEERAVFLDLQDRYNALFEENMTDQQTGCYNRKGMKYYSDIVIDEARKSGKYLFVCETDLNGLKYLNDTYGHAAGDEAIAAVSSQLLKSAPKGSRCVRIGGDEFLIFAALNKDSAEPAAMEKKLDEGLEEYNKTHPHPYEIGACYGWVLLPVKDDMVNLDEYVALADEKMYEMKLKRDKHRRK